jgi:glucan biosynthesis protein C
MKVERKTPARLKELDAARGMFMIAGVFYHAALMFSLNGVGGFKDWQRAQEFSILSDLLHTFRMPAFFWIAGYFCMLGLERHSVKEFLRRRFWRLVVPLLILWPTLNALHDWMFYAWRGGSWWEILHHGVRLGHLWFICNLILYSTIAVLIVPLMRMNGWRRGGSDINVGWLSAALAVSAFTFLACVLVRALTREYMNPGIFRTPWDAFYYGSFFFIGLISAEFPSLGKALLSPHWALAFVAIPAAYLLDALVYNHSSFWVRELALFLQILSVWLAVGSAVGLAVLFWGLNPRFARVLTNSSYTVYLVHQVFIVALSMMVSGFGWGAAPKFILVCIGTLFFSLAVHFLLVARFSFLRVAFGGGPP